MAETSDLIYLSIVTRYFRKTVIGFDLDFYREPDGKVYMKKVSPDTGRTKIYRITGYADSPKLTLISNIKSNNFTTNKEETLTSMCNEEIDDNDNNLIKEFLTEDTIDKLNYNANEGQASRGKTTQIVRFVEEYSRFLTNKGVEDTSDIIKYNSDLRDCISLDNFLLGNNVKEAKEVIEDLIKFNKNIFITGMYNTGKTVLMNILLEFFKKPINILTYERYLEKELNRKYPERNIIFKNLIENNDIVSKDYNVHVLYKEDSIALIDDLKSNETIQLYLINHLTRNTHTLVTGAFDGPIKMIDRIVEVSSTMYPEVSKKSLRLMVSNTLGLNINLKINHQGVRYLESISEVNIHLEEPDGFKYIVKYDSIDNIYRINI